VKSPYFDIGRLCVFSLWPLRENDTLYISRKEGKKRKEHKVKQILTLRNIATYVKDFPNSSKKTLSFLVLWIGYCFINLVII
jgi:hypothetical protein